MGQRPRLDAGSPSSRASLGPVPGLPCRASLSNPDVVSVVTSNSTLSVRGSSCLPGPLPGSTGRSRPQLPGPARGAGPAFPLTVRGNEGGRPWVKEAARTQVLLSLQKLSG